MLLEAYFKFILNMVFLFAFTGSSELSQTLPESQAGTCYVTESAALINCRSFPIILTNIPDSFINWHYCFHCFNRRHKHLYLLFTERCFSKILLDFIAVASKVHGCLISSIPIVVSSTHLIASLYIFLALSLHGPCHDGLRWMLLLAVKGIMPGKPIVGRKDTGSNKACFPIWKKTKIKYYRTI